MKWGDNMKNIRQDLYQLYCQTLKNCEYYENENMLQCLLNEIGVLRGIGYAIEAIGDCPHSQKFLYYIALQGEMLFDERDAEIARIKAQQKRGDA